MDGTGMNETGDMDNMKTTGDMKTDDMKTGDMEQTGDMDDMETGDMKKGTHSIGVQRQCSGTAGRIEKLPSRGCI